jgi:hypothetical protein
MLVWLVFYAEKLHNFVGFLGWDFLNHFSCFQTGAFKLPSVYFFKDTHGWEKISMDEEVKAIRDGR